MIEEKCNKSRQEHINNLGIDSIPCCFERLIFIEEYFNTKNLTNYFSEYFLKYMKFFYKKNLLIKENLTEKTNKILLNLLIKYSSLFYFLGKKDKRYKIIKRIYKNLPKKNL